MYGQPIDGGGRVPPVHPTPTPNDPTKTSTQPQIALAVIVSVDSNNNPTVATVAVNDALPLQTGYAIPSSLGVTFAAAPPFATWQANTAYALNSLIQDSNSNTQICVVAGTSGASHPTWATVAGNVTTDNTAQWAMLASSTSPPTGMAYYNNATTQTGGSLVYVDTVNRKVLNLAQGQSVTPPANPATLFQYIIHNGAYNPSLGGMNPVPIDVNQMKANPSPGTGPVITGTPPSFTYNNVGASAFDVAFNITLTTTNPNWLYGLNFYAVNHGAAAPTTATNPWSSISPASASGTYSNVNLLGLTAGISGGWDIYVAFLDNAGGVSTPTLINTTVSNPQLLIPSNLIGVPTGFAYSGTESSVSYGAVNSGAYSVSFTGSLTVTNFGSGSPVLSSWVDHVSILVSPSGAGNFSEAAQIPVGALSFNTNTSPVSLGTVNINNLGAGQAYDVRYRLVGMNPGSYVDSATVFTTTAQFIGASAGQSMPSGIKSSGPTISASTKNSRTRTTGTTQDLSGTVTFSDFGSTSGRPQWLAAIYCVQRLHGTTTILDQIQIDPSSFASQTSTTTTFNWVGDAGTGDTCDIGFMYEDVSTALSAIAWPSATSSIADPDGGLYGGGTGNPVVYPRHDPAVRNLINQDYSTNDSKANLAPNADFTAGTGTTGIDGTYNQGTVPEFYEAYRGTNTGLCVYSIDNTASAPFGTALKLVFSANTDKRGFGTGDSTNAPDGFGPLTLKANANYVVSYYAKSSSAGTTWGLTGASGITVTALPNYPTSYNDTAWHRYAFLVTVGSSDYTGGLYPFTPSIAAGLGTMTNPTLTPSATGGSLTNGSTYYGRLSATNSNGETLASAEQSCTISGSPSYIPAPSAPSVTTPSGTNNTAQTWYIKTAIDNANGSTTPSAASGPYSTTAGGGTQKTVVYTSLSGATWPADFSSLVSLEAVGAGANGIAGNTTISGSGGKGGGYAKITSGIAITPGASITGQIGAAGGTGTSGDTWVGSTGTILAPGGGGTSTAVGSTTYAGGAGGAGYTGGGAYGGGGGGAAGPHGAGVAGASGSAGGVGGHGDNGSGGAAGAAGTEWGSSPAYGCGGGGSGGAAGFAGNAGGTYGAGGGGGGKTSSGTSGAGAATGGLLILTYLPAGGTVVDVSSPANPGVGNPTGYDVYASTTSGGTYYKQNSSPIAIGTAWTSPATGIVTSGTAAPSSNTASYGTGSVAWSWTALTGATGYNPYGRTSGSEQKLATLGNVTTYTDTGSATPSGALPSSDTTGGSLDVWFAAPKIEVGNVLSAWSGTLHRHLPGVINSWDEASNLLNTSGFKKLVPNALQSLLSDVAMSYNAGTTGSTSISIWISSASGNSANPDGATLPAWTYPDGSGGTYPSSAACGSSGSPLKTYTGLSAATQYWFVIYYNIATGAFWYPASPYTSIPTNAQIAAALADGNLVAVMASATSGSVTTGSGTASQKGGSGPPRY